MDNFITVSAYAWWKDPSKDQDLELEGLKPLPHGTITLEV